MSKVLVVANETVGSDELLDELRRIEDEKTSKYVVLVPCRVIHSGEGALWSEEAILAAAENRLRRTLEILIEEGLDVEGVVGNYRPQDAIREAVEDFQPDLIVISTHPAERSLWLRQNLVECVRRAHDVPVKHVVSHVPQDLLA